MNYNNIGSQPNANEAFGNAIYNGQQVGKPANATRQILTQSYDYGYGYGNVPETFSRRYSGVEIGDSVAERSRFTYNPMNDTIELDTPLSNGKFKKKTVASGFRIVSTAAVYNNRKDKPENIIVMCNTKGVNHQIVIPYVDYEKEKFNKYFPFIIKEPGCSAWLFNDCISDAIKRAPSSAIIMYNQQGWVKDSLNNPFFVTRLPFNDIPPELITESVSRRDSHRIEHEVKEVVTGFIKLYSAHPHFKFLGLWRIGSPLLYFLDQIQIAPTHFLVITPSDSVSEDKLIAMLNTSSSKPISLDSKKKEILHEIAMTYDGIAVYVDHSFLDDAEKIGESIKLIVKALYHDLREDEGGRCLVTIISPNAGYIANRITPENVINISMDGISLDEYTAEQIKAITDEMEALVITTIINLGSQAENIINGIINDIVTSANRNQISEKERNIFAVFLLANKILHKLFGFELYTLEELISLWKNIQCDPLLSIDQTIVGEFASVVSRMIRESQIKIVEKRNVLTIETAQNLAIIEGNRVYISQELLDCIIAQMNTTKNKKRLIKALEEQGRLITKDGKTNPVDVHSLDGALKTLYMYNISVEIFDTDIIHRLGNINDDVFFISDDEAPSIDFLPLLKDTSGKRVGRLLTYKEAENGHVYITGQSGYGKSFILAQLIIACRCIKHQVVIFDSSDSFTREALVNNLSEEAVDKLFTFYDVDNEGLPVDLFSIDRSTSLPSQKKEFLGIISAGAGELTVPQTTALRKALSSVLSALSAGEKIVPEDILEFVDNEGNAGQSLKHRIGPLLDDIQEFGMADRTWEGFLNESNNIIVIHTDSSYNTSGDAMIDMMLATLYNYQKEQPHVPLDVFIDEIQNQNFSKISPIRMILKEGRKIHMSFFGATQDYYPRNTEIGSVMSKADTQIFLKPTINSQIVVASELRYGKGDMSRFDLMQRGDAIVKGSFYNKEQKRNTPAIISGKVFSLIH